MIGTDEDRARGRAAAGAAGAFAATHDENGVDLTLIRDNLRLTPLERARKADRLRLGVLRMHELARVRRHPEPD